ncbi:DUF6885 family protein [Nocardioides sp. Leaf374]|uniref:DUF6885 family protein n=1 Tax=Nocardioides sp. Leaf374 TaxID=2876560 RepID=UPI001E563B55|nr:hypothetical protein [Nocardioides sp. Leaf374]
MPGRPVPDRPAAAPLAVPGLLPGAERVLAAHGPALPQPDQLCGPFAAALALHAVLASPASTGAAPPASTRAAAPAAVPSATAIAVAAGTAIWPHDVADWRPEGAPLLRTGWDELPRAAALGHSGTDAAGLLRGVEAAAGDRVVVVPVPGSALDAGALGALLERLRAAGRPVGVVANVRTGPISPPGATWDVGHFVVLLAHDPEGGSGPGSESGGRVLVGDTYAELGAPGLPPGCRWVAVEALAEALAAPPGRGLLLLAGREDEAAVAGLVDAAGLPRGVWAT